MRVRAAPFVLLALLATACSGKHAASGRPESLRLLTHLSSKQSSFGVILDAKSGKALAAFRLNNPIRAAVPDGRGGWYIGGGFIRVDGVLRKRLAHIDENGRLDPRWKPEANGNGVSVTSLARTGSQLYVAGDFARLNGRTRLWLGAFDAATGSLTPWDPAQAALRYAVLLAGRDRVYLGGYALEPSRSGLGAVGPDEGRLERDWRGQVDTSNIEGGSVRILLLRRGALYLAGIFGTVDGAPVPGLAAVDAGTGALIRRWRPPLRPRYCTTCTDVTALADGGSRILAAVPSTVLALDPTTGAVDRSWRVRVGLTAAIYGGAQVTAVARAAGRVYLAGDFDSLGGVRREAFGAVDTRTGRVLPSWTSRSYDAVGSVLSASGTRVLLGIQQARTVRFDVGGLEASRQPFSELNVVLALSGPGSVRVGLGRRCNVRRWTETGRCKGKVARWLGSVLFDRPGRRRFRHAIAGPQGWYFVRFVPRPRDGQLLPPYDDAFRH